MNLSVIGVGYVGLVTGVCFAKLGHNVIGIDNNLDKLDKLQNGESPFFEPGLTDLLKEQISAGRINFSSSINDGIKAADIIFIAVGTYPNSDGSPDMSHVDEVAGEIAKNLTGKYTIIVQKSTVPPGTGKRLTKLIKKISQSAEFDIVSNPEFLREGTAISDTLNPDRIVVGGSSKKALCAMKDIFAPITNETNCPYLETDIVSAELIKYTANTFLATKISFINHIASVCEELGGDVELVARGIGLDNRIGMKFLRSGIGYGGSCLPKDVSAFIHLLKINGIDPLLFEAVSQINVDGRNAFIEKIAENVNLSDSKIGVLGLAFKPETDDMREAPSIYVIDELIKRGAIITAYDPEANQAAAPLLPDVNIVHNAYEVAQDADALVICTEWKEFQTLDFEKIMSLMKNPVIFDGRNCLNERVLSGLGFSYFPIGKKSIVQSHFKLLESRLVIEK